MSSLQSKETAYERVYAWFKNNPNIAQTDANIEALFKFVKDNFAVAGECIIDSAYLDIAYLNLGAKLQHIVGPETTAQIEQAQQHAAQLAAQLAEAQREKDKKAAAERKRLDNIARLESQGSRGNHGFATADDIAAENVRIQRETKARQKAATRMQRHELFISELAAANQMLITNVNGVKWGATEDARKAMKQALKRKYPEFASEAV